MLDTCTNNPERFQVLHSRRHHHDSCRRRHSISIPDGITSLLYQSPVDAHSSDSQSYYTTVSKQASTIELFFSRLLDAVIFTSAIALTAYNYWSGNLEHDQHPPVSQPPPMASSEIFQQYNFSRYDEQPTKRNDPLDDARKRRTQEWAETVTRQLMKQAPSPNLVLQPSTSKTKPAKKKTAKRERRSKSFDFQLKKYHHVDNATGDDQQQKKTKEKKNEDEMFARMEERLQNLIQEGQAALSSIPEVYDMDEKEMAMRQAFAKRHST